MTSIPGTVEELTTDWLREVLGERVTASRLADANSGTTGRAVLEVEGEGLPPRLRDPLLAKKVTPSAARPPARAPAALWDELERGHNDSQFQAIAAAEQPIAYALVAAPLANSNPADANSVAAAAAALAAAVP